MRYLHRWTQLYQGGDLAREGSYWDPKNLRLVRITGAIDFLPGTAGCGYVRLPILVVPIVAMLTGLLYVVALSLAPIFLVGYFGLRGITSAFHRSGPSHFATSLN